MNGFYFDSFDLLILLVAIVGSACVGGLLSLILFRLLNGAWTVSGAEEIAYQRRMTAQAIAEREAKQPTQAEIDAVGKAEGNDI